MQMLGSTCFGEKKVQGFRNQSKKVVALDLLAFPFFDC